MKVLAVMRQLFFSATSPALKATSSSALPFGNWPALSCGQHLTGPKGPMKGDRENALTSYKYARIIE